MTNPAMRSGPYTSDSTLPRSKSSTRPPGRLTGTSSSGMRTILPSSSHSRVMASMRCSSGSARHTATSSTMRSWRTSSMSSRTPDDGPVVDHRQPGLDGQEADDPQPQLAVALDLVGEAARLRAGAHDEQVARVVAAVAQDLEEPADAGPGDDGQGDLGDEQGQQEEPADVRELEYEQGREGDEADEHAGPAHVQDLGAHPPARPDPIHAQRPQHAHPGGGIGPGGDERVHLGVLPGGLPGRPEAGQRDEGEQDDGADRVSGGQGEPEGGGVATDHRGARPPRAGSTGSSGTPTVAHRTQSPWWPVKSDSTGAGRAVNRAAATGAARRPRCRPAWCVR